MRRLAFVMAGLVILIGAAALVGWAWNIEVLKRVLPGFVSMKPNTALLFIFTGISLLLRSDARSEAAFSRRVARLLAIATILVAVATMLEYVLDRHLAIDRLLFSNRPGALRGRMAPTTALNFVLLGVALLMLDVPRLGRWQYPAEGLAFAAGAMTVLTFIGYVYGVGALYHFRPYSSIAINTAIAFCLLSGGILLSRSERGVMALFTASTPGGMLTRRMLPAAILVPLLFGWLLVSGERAGWYALAPGTAAFACIMMIVFTVLIVRSASTLNLADLKRQHEHEASLQNKARLDGIISSAMDAIISIDSNQRILVFNPAAEQMFGVSASEALGRSIERFIPLRFRHAHAGHVRKFGATGATTRRMNALDSVSGLRANGEEFPVEASISHMEIHGEKLFTVILRDITERKRAEEAVRSAEQQLRSVTDYAPISLVHCDAQNRYRFVNEYYSRRFGLNPGDVVGRHIREVVGETAYDSFRKYVDATLRGERVEYEEVIPYSKLGRRWMHCIYVPQTESTGTVSGFVAVIQDVTDRRQAEQDLHALTGRLQAVREEERTRLARQIHDVLAQELTRIKLDLTRATRRLAQPADSASQESLREQLKGTIGMVDSAMETVQQIATELRPVVLDTLGLCAAIEWQAREFQARTEIVCAADVSEGDVGIGREHSTALFRILQESLTNVARHAEASRVDVRLYRERGQIRLTIQDNGRGILPTQSEDHRALGLLGMRERAELLGGQCRIEGGPGQGTCVEVTFPLTAFQPVESIGL